MNQRDYRGWLIPKKGNKSWYIYQLMINGFSTKEISELMQECGNNRIRVLASMIRHPKERNARQLQWYKDNPKRAKEITAKAKANGKCQPYSKYVRKLVHSMGISYTEAVAIERKELEKIK